MAEGGYDPRNRHMDSKSRPVCRFYLKNNCIKGDRCLYRHVNNARENGAVCKYYQMGCCNFGRSCKFIHVDAGKHKDNSHGQRANQKSGSGSKPPVREFPSRMVTLRKEEYDDDGWETSESVREFPSRMVTLRKEKSNDGWETVSQSVRDPGKKDFNHKWASAQDFVPGKKFHGSVPTTYASAVQPLKDGWITSDSESDWHSDVKDDLLLCPFFEQSGNCPFEATCEYAHAFVCEFCGMPKLHPTDEEQREKHVKECIEEHEKQMEHAFAVQASEDKECGICLENVMEKEFVGRSDKRFGILENCNHCFCLSCIRTWRQNKSDVIQTQRSCPTCRTHSDFVTPSKFWVESPVAKRKLIDDYKSAMGSKACQYFKRGKGECPFDDRCFYKHALEDGTVVHQNVTRRRRRFNAEGERRLEEYSLWDFITSREEDGHILPLDAHLSLVFLGIFQDSDDEDDDNNSNFAWSLLNGDFFISDSNTDTDSD